MGGLARFVSLVEIRLKGKVPSGVMHGNVSTFVSLLDKFPSEIDGPDQQSTKYATLVYIAQQIGIQS
jgi:hypothetical protein